MSESNESQHSTSRRRWWLYALSLVVIAVVGVVCSLVPIWRESEAIAALRDRGFDVSTESRLPTILRDPIDEDYRTAVYLSNCTVPYMGLLSRRDIPEYGFSVSTAKLSNMPRTYSKKRRSPFSFIQVNDEDLASISRLNNLEALVLSYVNLTETQADMIGGFPKLRNLSLASQQIKDDAFVRAITRAGCLESLYLNNLVIDPETIELISALPNLKKLGIANPQVNDVKMADLLGRLDVEELSLSHFELTDEDYTVLGKFARLEILDLEFSNLNDEGLRHLRSFRNLRWLGVSNTMVTIDGVAELEQTLPDCLINKDF